GLRPPARPTLVPYTTLFRSGVDDREAVLAADHAGPVRLAPVGLGRHAGGVGAHRQDVGAHVTMRRRDDDVRVLGQRVPGLGAEADRKSTRLNSSHVKISYAV